MAKKVLVVDDEKLIVKGLKFSLEQDQYEVDTAFDGETAIELTEQNRYDLILLDVMLPGKDGMEVLRHIREKSMIPIIMLTAKGDDMDKILGLEYGADDYITKPFNILEVKARMKAILRRNAMHTIEKEENRSVLKVKDLSLNLESRQVFMEDREIILTVKEFDLLEHLMRNPNKVYSRDNLLNIVWGYDYPGDVRTVDVHVRRIREKIEEIPSEPQYLLTKWGIGYYFIGNKDK
ncbi:MAG: response regulator transcription factor [Eubacteriales bacterium]|nr:response regulator transcription factor [Eubacteriales bacterium]